MSNATIHRHSERTYSLPYPYAPARNQRRCAGLFAVFAALLLGSAVGVGAALVSTVAAKSHHSIELVLQPKGKVALASLASDITDASSSNFHAYLTPAQFANRFGATPATVRHIDSVLRSHGATDITLSPNRLSIEATVPSAAGTDLGATSTHSGLKAELVSEFGSNVEALITSTGPAQVHTNVVTASVAPHSATSDTSTSCGRGGLGTSSVTASDLARAYGLSSLYGAGDKGAGVTVALVEFAPFSQSDISTYARCAGASAAVAETSVEGGPTVGISSEGSVEAELDIEAVLGLAPKATIHVFEGRTDTQSDVIDTYSAAIASGAKVISISWGTCEEGVTPADRNLEQTIFQQAAVQGQTVVASAGDHGSADCYGSIPGQTGQALAVDDPASQPYVTGVGGTSITSPVPSAPQKVWNNGSTYAGGGGTSIAWTIPKYQRSVASAENTSVNRSLCGKSLGACRAVPDVSADAGTGFSAYCTIAHYCSGWTPEGGTSLSAPIWASVFALADSSVACHGATVGFANPSLYSIAASPARRLAFGDITAGTNHITGAVPGAYSAESGFDLASGLGTPIAGNGLNRGLVADLCSIATQHHAAH